jgi:hypothetical protein
LILDLNSTARFIVALAGGFSPAAREVIRSVTGEAPPLYPDLPTMLENQRLDLLISCAEIGPAMDSPVPVPILYDHAVDPLAYLTGTHSGKGIQILPRYEFAGAARAGATDLASYLWTKASIRHRTSLPATRVAFGKSTWPISAV